MSTPSQARTARENAAVIALRDSQVKWIARLQSTSTIAGYPPNGPDGWLFVPRPTAYGDQLVCVVAYDDVTGLYHSHFWSFEARLDGHGRRVIDLPRFLGQHPNLTGHRVHLYSRPDGNAVLCLSQRVNGGMPDLTSALVQTLKWQDGTSLVVRGRQFPYQ